MLFIETLVFTKQASGGHGNVEHPTLNYSILNSRPTRLSKLTTMDTELFNELKDSIRQMKVIEAGDATPAPVRGVYSEKEVAHARIKLGLKQEAFAKLLDTPVGTVRGWEQGRRQPPLVRRS